MAYNFPDSPTLNQTFDKYKWDGEKWILTSGGRPYLAPITTTWNPADKNATIVLSNGNLTADSTGFGGGYGAVRATTGKSTGKYYFEGKYIAGSIGSNQLVGIGSASANLSQYIGNPQSCGVDGAGSITGNIGGGNIGSQAINDIISLAVDVDAKTIWFRKNGGVWNASGTNDPATGVGGKSFSGVVSLPIFPMNSGGFGSAIYTANFGATAFSYAVPSGFTVGWP